VASPPAEDPPSARGFGAGEVYRLHRKPRTEGERGLPKRAVPEAWLRADGLEGDFNRYRHEIKHDDPGMALLLLPLETIEVLRGEGWPVAPGDLGENLTTRGIPYGAFVPGEDWTIGNARVRIEKACTPCTFLFGLPYVGTERGPSFLKATLDRRGWYARVLSESVIRVGDPIRRVNGALP
jgi:MOSC domain-containing protein YiiM